MLKEIQSPSFRPTSENLLLYHLPIHASAFKMVFPSGLRTKTLHPSYMPPTDTEFPEVCII
jgi:hypothetical protein